MHRILKKAKHTEQYQQEKLFSSIQASCLSVHEFVGSAETTAQHVCHGVERWLETKYEVTSDDIRRVAAATLAHYNPAAAYVYETHNDIN